MSSKEKLKSVLERIKTSGKMPVDVLKDLSEQEKETIRHLYVENLIEEALKFLDDLDTDQEWHTLTKKVAKSKRQVIPLWKSMAKYAAIFVGLLAMAYFYRTAEKAEKGTPISEESIRLKIGEDAIKIINEGETQQIVSASGKVLGRQVGNKLHYDPNTEIDELVYNELEVPHGKIFDVELSDGTLVHLNSGTTMRYPVKFLTGRKREVFVDGEAYFKVAKDREHAFIVYADAVMVEVLGTEFNIASYGEDPEIATVLVEGSVNLSSSISPDDFVPLKPGQKAAWNKNAQATEIEEVDVNLYTSWIKGEMIFRNATFEAIAQKLERRYNINIQNNNPLLKDKRLNARFNVKIESIEDVLKSIKEIQDFTYKITGREVTID